MRVETWERTYLEALEWNHEVDERVLWAIVSSIKSTEASVT